LATYSNGIKAFTGREWDPEIGLYYYRARYYDPKVGRFVGEDPIGFAGGVNFHVYTEVSVR
jgi:RHS repeat-associated protein